MFYLLNKAGGGLYRKRTSAPDGAAGEAKAGLGMEVAYVAKRATSRTQSPSQGTTIDATLQMILLTTALAGAITISAAAALSYSLRTRMVERVLSLSTGLLLGAALLYALPLAFEATADKRSLCATLLAGLLSFFVLEKYATLQRARRRPGQAPQRTGKAGWMILVGDGLHNFTDGILIAAAFLARPELGVLTALAIGAHTLAREVGDFIILLDAGYSRRRALVCNLLCSSLAAAGGLVGYLALARGMAWMPHVLVLAASGFLYIALSDLMPKIQQAASARDTVVQMLLLGAGVTLVLYLPDRISVY
jgi:zinc and cadmium transporter